MSFFKKMFKRKKHDNNNLTDIVNAYGAVLGNVGAEVRDVSELPVKKDELKVVILKAISLTPDISQREHLKAGFVELAGFQKLSNSEAEALNSFSGLLNNGESLPDNEIKDVARLFLQSGEILSSLRKKVADESKTLLAELNKAGY